MIVTGGNAGIGLETAKGLAARGARTILACRSKERGKVQSGGSGLRVSGSDFSDRKDPNYSKNRGRPHKITFPTFLHS